MYVGEEEKSVLDKVTQRLTVVRSPCHIGCSIVTASNDQLYYTETRNKSIAAIFEHGKGSSPPKRRLRNRTREDMRTNRKANIDDYGRPGERRRKRVFVRPGEKCDNYIYYLFMRAMRLYIMRSTVVVSVQPSAREMVSQENEPRRPRFAPNGFVLCTKCINYI